MKLSEKKKSELYKIVSDEIMDVRIVVAKMGDTVTTKEMDDILYKLQYSASQKAINIFNQKTITNDKD